MCRRLIVLMLGLALAGFTFVNFAQECTKNCPPPVKKDAACSPGYYKNHVDTWCGVSVGACGVISNCEEILADLNATGAHNGELKQAAGDFLNGCFGTNEASPCEED